MLYPSIGGTCGRLSLPSALAHYDFESVYYALERLSLPLVKPLLDLGSIIDIA